MFESPWFRVIPLILLSVIAGCIATVRYAFAAQRKARYTSVAGANLRDNPAPFIVSANLLSTMLLVASGMYAGEKLSFFVVNGFRSFLVDPFLSRWFGIATLLFCVIALFTIIAEIVPRRIGRIYSEEIVRFCYPFARTVTVLLYSFVRALESSVEVVLRIGARGRELKVEFTENEFKELISAGTQTGMFSFAEARLLTKVMRFADKSVMAVMTPRNDIVWLDRSRSIKSQWHKIKDSGHSQFPVTKEDIDRVEGVVTLNDVSQALIEKSDYLPISMVRKVLQIPCTMPALAVLEEFRRNGGGIAVVIDEYGGVNGMVTSHDLMETLVGEIRSGNSDGERLILTLDDGAFVASSALDIDELFDVLKLPVETNDVDNSRYYSLGGLVMELLGEIPKLGDSFVYENYKFTIVQMDGRRLDKVRIEKA